MAENSFAPWTGPVPLQVADGVITPTYLMGDDAYRTIINCEIDMKGQWNVCPAGHLDCCEHGSL